jgi:hypothetical protein
MRPVVTVAGAPIAAVARRAGGTGRDRAGDRACGGDTEDEGKAASRTVRRIVVPAVVTTGVAAEIRWSGEAVEMRANSEERVKAVLSTSSVRSS